MVIALVAVAATDGRGNLVANSNWGARTIAVGAPGQNIPTVTPNGTGTRVSGSSPAAALVSAAAANALTRDPNLTASSLRQTIIETADRTRGLRGKTISGGQLDPSL